MTHSTYQHEGGGGRSGHKTPILHPIKCLANLRDFRGSPARTKKNIFHSTWHTEIEPALPFEDSGAGADEEGLLGVHGVLQHVPARHGQQGDV